MRAPALLLVPIYMAGWGELVRHLALRLEKTFQSEVEVRPPWFDPEKAFEPTRGQYCSGRWLAELETAEGESKVAAITSVDLFVPVLTYVFGEARVPGRAAVASIHRLRSELYGLPADAALLGERAEKELIHELGHTFGLVHCPDSECVMHASTYVEDIDLKPATFCTGCRGRVG